MNVWCNPTHHLKRQLDRCTHFRTTMQQNSHALEHHCVPVVSECHLHRTRHVATQQPGLKPGELYHLGGPALLVVCTSHLPKIIEFYLHIQMLSAKFQVGFTLRGPPCMRNKQTTYFLFLYNYLWTRLRINGINLNIYSCITSWTRGHIMQLHVWITVTYLTATYMQWNVYSLQDSIAL